MGQPHRELREWSSLEVLFLWLLVEDWWIVLELPVARLAHSDGATKATNTAGQPLLDYTTL